MAGTQALYSGSLALHTHNSTKASKYKQNQLIYQDFNENRKQRGGGTSYRVDRNLVFNNSRLWNAGPVNPPWGVVVLDSVLAKEVVLGEGWEQGRWPAARGQVCREK